MEDGKLGHDTEAQSSSHGPAGVRRYRRGALWWRQHAVQGHARGHVRSPQGACPRLSVRSAGRLSLAAPLRVAAGAACAGGGRAAVPLLCSEAAQVRFHAPLNLLAEH